MSLQKPESGTTWMALAILLTAAACGGPTPPPARPSIVPEDAEQIPANPVLDEKNSGVEDSSRLLIESAEEWASFHRRVFQNRSASPEPPEVDFASSAIVAAAMGRRPTGGYDVLIQRVFLSGDTVYAEVAEISPGPGCVVSQALTAPVRAVQVPAPDAGTLVTAESDRELNCD